MAAPKISFTEIRYTMDVDFKRPITLLHRTGRAAGTACGKTTRNNVFVLVSPMEYAASYCPFPTERRAPRTVSVRLCKRRRAFLIERTHLPFSQDHFASPFKSKARFSAQPQLLRGNRVLCKFVSFLKEYFSIFLPVIQQNFTIICETVCRKRKTHSPSVGKTTNKVFD